MFSYGWISFGDASRASRPDSEEADMDISGLSREKVRRPPEIMEYGACSLPVFIRQTGFWIPIWKILLEPNR
jgi:hypothetical protein